MGAKGCYFAAQVDCTPPGNIIVEVVDSRASDGGFIAVALLEVSSTSIL